MEFSSSCAETILESMSASSFELSFKAADESSLNVVSELVSDMSSVLIESEFAFSKPDSISELETALELEIIDESEFELNEPVSEDDVSVVSEFESTDSVPEFEADDSVVVDVVEVSIDWSPEFEYDESSAVTVPQSNTVKISVNSSNNVCFLILIHLIFIYV